MFKPQIKEKAIMVKVKCLMDISFPNGKKVVGAKKGDEAMIPENLKEYFLNIGAVELVNTKPKKKKKDD